MELEGSEELSKDMNECFEIGAYEFNIYEHAASPSNTCIGTLYTVNRTRGLCMDICTQYQTRD